MDMSWLMIGVMILISLFFFTSWMLAHNAVVAAKHHDIEAPTPSIVWAMGFLVIVLGAALALMIAQKLSMDHGYGIMAGLVAGFIWAMLLFAAKHIVLYYYPDTQFQKGRDVAVETLGQHRQGYGLILSLL